MDRNPISISRDIHDRLNEKLPTHDGMPGPIVFFPAVLFCPAFSIVPPVTPSFKHPVCAHECCGVNDNNSLLYKGPTKTRYSDESLPLRQVPRRRKHAYNIRSMLIASTCYARHPAVMAHSSFTRNYLPYTVV